MALTQAESYAPYWEAHRDNWRPCTPADVWGLREDREFQPPSRAHVKRLTKTRPEVFPTKPEIPVAHDSGGARAHANARRRAAMTLAQICADANRVDRL